jgi:hypothetical protein
MVSNIVGLRSNSIRFDRLGARAKRRIFSARLAPAMQPGESPLVAKAVLREAQKAGLEPKELYDENLLVRSPRWPPAPSWDEVNPAV